MNYLLFKGNKRVSLKSEDMRAQKIARIFQVDTANLYLTGSANIALFPLDNGDFCSVDLDDRGHYEVHGGERPALATPQRSFAFMQASSSSSPQAFNFTPPPRASLRSYQRSIHLSEIRDGRLASSRVLVVRFIESEANVPSMLDKIKLAMGNSDTYVITDAQGNEVFESEGTAGSCYWRQNSRKFHAVERAAFRQWQLRRAQMSSRRHADTSALQDLKLQIVELLEASHGLEAVSQQIQNIVSSAERAMPRTLGTALKETFSCSICTGIMENPVFISCCRSIVGCKLCVNQWGATSTQCPKCLSEEYDITEVAGLSSALDAIKNMF
ncbi:uncharacterized protein LOC143742497 [Siphateles boraxobius]|uniref:uncharacterized protein LOC143742497 n=1 Tax=Siphateles boraxobius TaxID=180520 RepID=UPI004062B938